ncbi:hypothetical protein C1H46_026898 [Malus baccata]|uniref:Asn/Gln amidotransferase domain-containing protein n=1 Tax=Malus baccata TaxID=106549 RepID=A0A540LM37_MALBA|nr:hypothetical protein C1H46_026898 [Malus baccata]
MVEKVVSENRKQLEQCRGGKTKLQGYFAGQVMKLSKGKANQWLLNKIPLEKVKRQKLIKFQMMQYRGHQWQTSIV